MSFADKRFCFSCKLDAEQLKKKNKELKTCSYCKIAQYCGEQCQRRNFKDSHKKNCVQGVKHYRDLTEKAKNILKEKGYDLDRIDLKKCSLQEFYDDNYDIFQCIAGKSKVMVIHDGASGNLLLERGIMDDLGEVFKTYINCETYSVRLMGFLARQGESYHGLQVALEANLEVIMALQPHRLYLRAIIPLLLIQLGRDDEAYNFIKFWLKNTPKEQDFTLGEEGLFPDLPFLEHTMKDEDKNEDIFEVLGIKMDENPYFIYITFYICLAIVKKNIYDTTKDENQLRLFIKYLGYAKKHFGDILVGLQFNSDFPRITPQAISAKYGLKKGLFTSILPIQVFASAFVNNFIEDLNSHLTRAPGLREALVNYL